MNKYPYGQLVRINAEFRDLNGLIVDPASVALRIKNPGASIWNASVTKDATGYYHADITAWTPLGRWVYRWVGSGNNLAAAQEGEFQVGPSDFT